MKAYKNIIYESSKSLPAILSCGGELAASFIKCYLPIGWQQGQNTLSEWGINLGSDRVDCIDLLILELENNDMSKKDYLDDNNI